jgi:serine/threonine-protein kinase
MPYVPGQTLRERLAREGALAVEEALRITGEAGRALHYAHREGVIHRDVKPENILLTLDGDTLVADFGIARAVGSIGDADQVRLTQAGIALGTPAYMAPEQATGQRMMDARTDQYSLAVVCYEMLTGKKPFTGSSAAAIIASRFTSPPPSARAHRAGIPARAEQAILRALSLDPAERFESVLDFIRALGAPGLTPAAGMPAIPDAALPATAAPAAVPELPPAPAALKRSWVILAVLALLALVVAGIVATRG